jgi:Rap1a immunity proteins
MEVPAMRNPRLILALALSAAASVGVARGEVVQDNFLVRNTGDLLALCSAPQSSPLYTAAVNFCQGFAVEVFRVLEAENAARGLQGLFCTPNPMPTRNQAIAAFVQWVRENPNQMAHPPADGIAAYLAHQYPCPPTR